MKIRRVFGMVAAALVACMAYTTAVQAQVLFPKTAHLYEATLVRAMDQCITGITVVNPGAIQGCAQGNTTTDATVTGEIKGKVKVREKNGGPFVALQAKNFLPAGTQAGVQLTIRVTNDSNPDTSLLPDRLTFSDQTIICGPTAGGVCGNHFVSNVSGVINAKQSLVDCLTANGLSTALASAGNIEVMDVEVINCATGKVIAVPGVLQK